MVVRGENHRAVIDHPLAMNNPEPKENPRQQFGKMIADPVVRIQNALTDFHPFHLQAPDDFADHAFDRQVRAVDDMRVLGDDEGRCPAGRIGPVPRRDKIEKVTIVPISETPTASPSPRD